MTRRLVRPAAPNPEILEEASQSLASLLGVPGGRVVWRVGERIDRPRSTVFPIVAVGLVGEPMRLYYKQMDSDTVGASENDLARLERTRAGLARTLELEELLAPLLSAEGVLFSRALVVDPAILTTVTLAVPGQAFGTVWKHLTSREAIRKARESMRRIGRAARHIEACTTQDIDSTAQGWEFRTESRVSNVARVAGDRLAGQLDSALRSTRDAALAPGGALVYTHGDLSPSNILVDEGPGLIDFAWVPRMRTYDIAKLAFRLDYGSPMPASWTRPLTDSLLEGYGDAGLTSTPAWRYHRLWMLSGVVADGRRGRGGRYRRAVRELSTLVDDDQ